MVEKFFVKLSSLLQCPADMQVVNTASCMIPSLSTFVFIAQLVQKREHDSCCLLQISLYNYESHSHNVNKTVCWPLPIHSLAIDPVEHTVYVLSPSCLAQNDETSLSDKSSKPSATLLFRVSLKQLLCESDSSLVNYTPLNLVGLYDMRAQIQVPQNGLKSDATNWKSDPLDSITSVIEDFLGSDFESIAM